ncbi:MULTISPECIES: rod shape-determining protein MreC [unclassified Campylobacter]|uniref:rod shape-determining protein MreC n=1 Tax=unclassified Campylobacter TaxID=2593542 RepID=UPI003D34E2BE
MKTKILFFIFVVGLIALSIYKGSEISRVTTDLSNSVVSLYLNFAQSVKDSIGKHFSQASQIEKLKQQNAELERSATLLATFANELNTVLKDKNATKYDPRVKLVRALSYANMGDYSKFYVGGFSDFNESKIYGLIYQGNSAGVLVQKDGKPLALLQNDPKSIFAVFIGDKQIPGMAHGTKNGVVIKFIPQWLSVNIGDEVFTSGLDGIFFSGVPVGKVTEVIEESSYYSAIVEPYMKAMTPNFLYVVIKDK